jgi:hypothetical protein
LAQSQLIKFEDQQRLEEHPFTKAEKGLQLADTETDAFNRSLGEERTDKKKKSEGVSKILKIKGVGKAEDQKERLARYGAIQYLENHFHEKQ